MLKIKGYRKRERARIIKLLKKGHTPAQIEEITGFHRRRILQR